MENDVNSAQPITEQPDAQDVSQSVTGEGVDQPTTGESAADGQQTQAVPYDRFKEVNDKAKAAQQEVDNLKLQMQILQNNQIQQKTPAQQNLFEKICKEKGYDDDYLTKTQQAEVTQEVVNRQINQIQSQIQMQTFLTQHPDYSEVVGTSGPNGFNIAPPLARQIQKNPLLLQALQRSPDRHILAYQIAVSDPEYVQSKTTQTTNDAVQQAEQILSGKMQSISSVPGSGNVDKAAMIRNMSDEEFQAHKASVIAKA